MKKLFAITLILFVLAAAWPQNVEASNPMAQTINVPEREYTPGNYEVQLNTLPGNSGGASIILTRVATNPEGELAFIQVQMRVGNTAPWQDVMAGTFSGGVMLDKQGNVLTQSSFLFTWPGEVGPNGRVMLKGSDVRILATVYQTFRTAITINSITDTAGALAKLTQ